MWVGIMFGSRLGKQLSWIKSGISKTTSNSTKARTLIFDGVQENGVWRKRMNHELSVLYGELSL